jgi:hypothetical protein
MNSRSLWKYVPPAGPVLSLLLIGLVLLSALLYYRAVKIQRYLEPALAISHPRNEFSKNINGNFQMEFGPGPVDGLAVKTSAILVQRSLLFSADGAVKPSGRVIAKKLARIFLSLMKNDHIRSEINLVLVSARFHSHGTWSSINAEREKVQHMVGLVQDALFQAEPELGRTYGAYFVVAAQPAFLPEGEGDVLEFRIVPSELMHIEVLQKLMKYAF